jgi:drug/metabolite transporter (DMT)-like permease
VVYPVSRGVGLALIPLGGALLLGEQISPAGGLGIALIVSGVYAIHLEAKALADLAQPLRSVLGPAGRTSLLTGGVIAAYSLWDKNALDVLSPLPLNEFGMIGLSVTLVPFALRGGLPQLQAEWRQRPAAIVSAGVLIPAAYLLVLTALTTSRVSYVGPAREIGIVFGTLFGVLLLREGYGRLRIPAACLIVAGVILLALAP